MFDPFPPSTLDGGKSQRPAARGPGGVGTGEIDSSRPLDLSPLDVSEPNLQSPSHRPSQLLEDRRHPEADVGGVSDVVTDGVTGRLVPVDDPAACTQALEALLDDPALGAQLAAAARLLVLERYSAARLVQQVDQLYVDLMRDGQPVTG